MDKKHCLGCRNDFYNDKNHLGVKECWSFKKAKLVTKLGPIGHWENPPYKNKEKKKIPNCWHGEGSNRVHWVEPDAITSDGYWK